MTSDTALVSEFGRCQWQADAALELLLMQGGSERTEKHHLVKGLLGSAPQLQGTRLGFLHVDSFFLPSLVDCSLNFCSNCLGAF